METNKEEETANRLDVKRNERKLYRILQRVIQNKYQEKQFAWVLLVETYVRQGFNGLDNELKTNKAF